LDDELPRQIIAWIRESVIIAGCNGVVLGMSGGIDSSVVSVLCKYAFPDTVLGVILPCYSDDTDREHAQKVAGQFSIPVKVVDLNEVYSTFIKNVSCDCSDTDTKKIAEANIKPRLRMMVLYYYANLFNYMVVGATNKSELEIGYFTKYGDGGVDLMPIGILVKGQVRQLAVYLGIPAEIIDKAPSAGLWDGQTDEEEMGLSYAELDRYILTGECDGNAMEKIGMLAGRSCHKKSLPIVPSFPVE
jgi:NAD+ synthase